MQGATRRREQEVWDACDDLWAIHADFKSLTGDSIRQRLFTLGKCKGSPNEIYKYRKTWMDSRGLPNSTQSALDATDHDPISRAVRLVHENLQIEAQERIQLLVDAHAEQLQEKEREVDRAKSDLSAVMIEFAKGQEAHTVMAKGLEQTKTELQAEIAVRKAMEIELDKILMQSRQDLEAKAVLLTELKEAHAQELQRFEHLHHAATSRLSLQLEQNEQMIRRLGQEYSDKLNEQKLTNHNVSILQKRAEERAELLLDKLSEAEGKIAELFESNQQLRQELSACEQHIGALKKDRALKGAEHRKTRYALKSCEMKLARLRAMLQGGRNHGA